MKTKKTLGLLALSAMLSIGLTACGGDGDEPVYLDKDDRAVVSGNDTGSGVDEPIEAPTNFADDAAKSALDEVCSKVSLTDMATLLGLPTVEMRDGVAEAQDSLDKSNAYCSFMAPSADEYGVDGWGGSQTFASISVAGPAVRACEGCSGGTVSFPDGSTGYYSGADDTALRVTPEGSAYEFSFSVVLPYEVANPSSLDQETSDLFRSKAADLAHMALD